MVKELPPKIWTIEEIHGIWWAYQEPRPEDKFFFSHSRPPRPPIMGPYHCKAFAEKKLAERKD